MVAIEKLLIVAGWLATGIVSVPVDTNLPENHEGSVHVSDKLIPDLANMRAKPKPKEKEKEKETEKTKTKEPAAINKPKPDASNPFGDISSIISKLGTPDGKSEILGMVLSQVNSAIDQAGGEGLEQIKGIIDESISSIFPKSSKGDKSSGDDSLAALGGLSKFFKF